MEPDAPGGPTVGAGASPACVVDARPDAAPPIVWALDDALLSLPLLLLCRPAGGNQGWLAGCACGGKNGVQLAPTQPAGASTGTTAALRAEGGPVPIPLVAVTVNVYGCRGRLLIVQLSGPDDHVQVRPPGAAVAV